MHLNDLFTISIALSVAVGCAGEDVGTEAQASSELRRCDLANTLQVDVDTNHRDGVVGVLAQIRDDHSVIRARAGESKLGSGVPVPFNASFRMGSNTKTFVAIVVLQLAAEERLSLDDTVERWLPGLVSGNGNDGSAITIRQLLQHTSGLPNYTADLFASFTADDYYRTRFEHDSPEQLVALALSHPPNFAPGTGWSYSNTNYILAGMIIRKVTGRDWPSEVRARITTPLHLTATFEPGDWPDLPNPHSHGYNLFEAGAPLVDVTRYNHTWGGAAGSLITTPDDLTRFWLALQRGELLPPAQMAEMQTTVPATGLDAIIPGVSYGLGILRVPTSCGGAYWAHFGDTFGLTTRNAVNLAGTRAVVVSNNTSFDVDPAETVIGDDLKLLDDVMCAP